MKKHTKKDNVINKPYNAKVDNLLAEFQKLINQTDFTWSNHLTESQVRFIYDSVMKANELKNYSLTTDQAKWASIILKKLSDNGYKMK